MPAKKVTWLIIHDGMGIDKIHRYRHFETAVKAITAKRLKASPDIKLHLIKEVKWGKLKVYYNGLGEHMHVRMFMLKTT